MKGKAQAPVAGACTYLVFQGIGDIRWIQEVSGRGVAGGGSCLHGFDAEVFGDVGQAGELGEIAAGQGGGGEAAVGRPSGRIVLSGDDQGGDGGCCCCQSPLVAPGEFPG